MKNPNLKDVIKKEPKPKNHPIRSRSWVESDAKSFGGAILRGWYKAHPEFVDESS